MNKFLHRLGIILISGILLMPNANAQVPITVGTGTVTNTATSYPAPYGNFYWGARHQMLIRASELAAAGATPGFITSLEFDVVTVNGVAMTDFTIKLGLTTDSVMSTTTGFLGNLTQTYTIPSYTETLGWNNHVFASNFFWDGVSNLIVETCFNNTAWTDNAVVNQTNTGFAASLWFRADAAGVCANTITTGTSNDRPNMRLGFLPNTGRDAAATAILSPSSPAIGGSATQVILQISNFAADPITSGSVGYSVNGGAAVTESWTGSLTTGQSGTHTFATPITLPTSGTVTVTSWVNNSNGLGADINTSNDTISQNFCIALPTGLYTVGPSVTADYPSVQAAVDALNCGGIAGSVTFAIEPGTYYGSYVLNGITGASLTNQITFTSSTGLAADVILIHDTTATAANKSIFTVTGVQGVTFNALTLRRTQNQNTGNFANVLANNTDNLSVLSCVFDETIPSSSVSFSSNGIRVDNGSSLLITGNTFTGFYNSIYLTGPTLNSNYEEFNNISANVINNYRYGIYVLNQSLPVITGNEISNAAAGFGYGVYLSRAVGLSVTNNKITGVLGNGGIYVFNPNDSTLAPNQIVNNVVSGSFTTTSTFSSIYGIYAGASFSATATSPVNQKDAIEVYFNTINITVDAPTNSSYGLLHITGGSHGTPAWNAVALRNNHVVGFGTGAGLGTNGVALFLSNDSTAAVTFSNNNNYYLAALSGGTIFNNLVRNNFGPTLYATLSAWTTASGQDAASVSSNPGFTSANLPIPTALAVDNLGSPIATVPSDILGIQRNLTTPDIGAYEFTPSPFDLATIGIVLQGGCSGPNQPVSVRIRNVGTTTWNFATDSVVINLNIGGVSTQAFTLTVNSDSLQVDSARTYLITSTANFSIGGTYNLTAELVASSDGNQLNNITTRNSSVVAPIASPYQEQFNGTAAPLNIVTDMSWNNSIGVGQTGGMRRNVFATLAANIATPIVGPLDTGAVFDFDYKITEWSGWSWPGTASVLGVTDTIQIQLSNDCGQSFTTIDSINSLTHVSSNAFATKRVNLSAYAGQQVILRIRFRQYSGIDVFFDLDNFRLFTPSPVDMGVLSVLAPNSGCSLTSADSVRVRVVNFGTVSQSNIPVSYVVNGGTVVTETISATMLPGDSLNYTFTAVANLGAVGAYTIRTYTGANNDGDFTNDTLVKVVANYPVISSLPYLEDFEGAAAGWFSGGTNSTWALGTPAASIINAAASGTKAWATNLTGNYVANERSYIQSPCFDLSGPGLVSPEVRFKLWHEVGQFDGGANLQYSTDGGATWQVLGTTTSGIQNWYNYATISGSGNPALNGWIGNTGSITFPGSGGYVDVAHSIAPLIGQSSVIFRVAFYTSAFSTLRNGIAVDDFRVFQPLDPVITSVDTLDNGCAVGVRNVTAAIFNFSPITSATLHYRLAPTAAFATAPMTFNATTSRYAGSIPAGTNNTRITYFVTTVDSAGLVDTSGSLSYVDAYLQPNAGNDTTITAGGTATLSGIGGSFIGTIGTGTITNTATTYPAPYGNFYWGARHQFLILASELSAAGINPGLLESLSFDVTQVGGAPMSDFEIKLGHTTVNDLTSWQSGLVQAYFTTSYTDTVGWNVHPFTTAFLWDGVSNLVVEVCFQNTSYVDNAVVNQSSTTFNSSYWYRADASGVCGNTLNTGSMMQRPNMRIEGGYNFEWRNLSSGAILSSTNPVLSVTPVVNTDYEFRLNDAGCTAADTVSVFVQAPLPDVGVTQVITPGTLVLGSAHTVKVVVKNHGSVPATGFDVAYTIDGVEVNANVVSRTIPPGDTVHHIFAQSFTPTVGGTIGMCSFTKSATDPNLANDTICMDYLNVGVEEVENLLNRVYPNPADQFVKFDFSGQEGKGLLEMRDNLGRVIYTEWIELGNGATHEVKTERFAAGVYNYRFVLRDKVQHGQVVIRR